MFDVMYSIYCRLLIGGVLLFLLMIDMKASFVMIRNDETRCMAKVLILHLDIYFYI